MSDALESILRQLFKLPRKTTSKEKECVLHHSHLRGWPKSPSLNLKKFPSKITIDAGPIPMLRPVEPIVYLFLESEVVANTLRATYVIDNACDIDNPPFIWVFLMN